MDPTESAGRPGKVLVTAKTVAASSAALALMSAAGLEVVVKTTPSPLDEQWLVAQVRDVDALVFAMEPVSARLLATASRLKVIARPGVGYDTIDLEAASQRGVIVTIAAGTNEQSVADFTIALLLQATRGIRAAAQSVEDGRWERTIGSEAWGKTLGIVGWGRIGQAVARRALGFDMRILVASRTPDLGPARAHGIEHVPLDTALREADFLTLHAPLTAETASLIDASSLAKMKRGAYLINTSRGGLIDEPALAAAVRSGQLAGAAVDVLRVQGAGSASPLIGVPGIIVTPHMATFTHESIERVAMSVARSVIATLQGRHPEHIVNPQAWHKQHR